MTKPTPVVVCGNGSPWGRVGCGPCAACIAEAEALEADFWVAVAAGRWDQDGYTPADRKAQARRLAELTKTKGQDTAHAGATRENHSAASREPPTQPWLRGLRPRDEAAQR